MVAWKTETNFNDVQTALIISKDAEMISVWETLFQQKNCHVVSDCLLYTSGCTQKH